MNDSQKPPSPRELLERREKDLAKKHQQRLAQMTTLATQQLNNQSKQIKKTSWQFLYNKPMAISAFSSILLILVLFFNHRSTETLSPLSNESLPQWVTDTEAPLTLLENLDFYDWLAQQPEDQQAKLLQLPRLAFAAFNEYRFGRRLTSQDVTQRVFGTTSYLRTVQR